MKTKFFGGIAILAIALAMAFNVSLNTGKSKNTSLLALANVEALAQVESGDYCDLYLYVGRSSRCYKKHDNVLMGGWKCIRTGNPSDYCTPLYTSGGGN
ncbi:MAG: hypothetical protein EOM47_13915 [Bacteroidia bacterium]|nr:hypothetical protein [Bacteroidia bacterium]